MRNLAIAMLVTSMGFAALAEAQPIRQTSSDWRDAFRQLEDEDWPTPNDERRATASRRRRVEARSYFERSKVKSVGERRCGLRNILNLLMMSAAACKLAFLVVAAAAASDAGLEAAKEPATARLPKLR